MTPEKVTHNELNSKFIQNSFTLSSTAVASFSFHIARLHCTLTKTFWGFCWLGWVGGDYGYWININIPICILTHWPALGTVLWPPTSVYAHWLHIRKSYSREKKPSTVSCVQASSHRLERPLQYFYQGCPGWSTPDYNIQVGTVFTLFHKNLGKVPKKGESAWKST